MDRSPWKLREQAERCRRLAGLIGDTTSIERLRQFAQELEAEAAAIEATKQEKQELRVNRTIPKLIVAELKGITAKAKEAVARAKEAGQRANDRKKPE